MKNANESLGKFINDILFQNKELTEKLKDEEERSERHWDWWQSEREKHKETQKELEELKGVTNEENNN